MVRSAKFLLFIPRKRVLYLLNCPFSLSDNGVLASIILLNTMLQKLCHQWNGFKESLITAFGSLRHDTDLADVTLVCEDGEQVK